jgi:hypothetical protein
LTSPKLIAPDQIARAMASLYSRIAVCSSAGAKLALSS